MRTLVWILRLLLFVVMLGFAVKNTDPVLVRFYLDTQWEAPLVFVMLGVFVVGAAAGIAACFGYLFRQRRELLQLRKQLRSQSSEQTP
ncbi:MAG: LapA family protein [Burkholderiales bacterium]